MAVTTGLVQWLIVAPGSGNAAAVCCAQIGPSPSNTTLLFVARRAGDSAQAGDFKTGIVEAMIAAQTTGREVVAGHGDTDSEITSLSLNP
jgi:hypothetical protein